MKIGSSGASRTVQKSQRSRAAPIAPRRHAHGLDLGVDGLEAVEALPVRRRCAVRPDGRQHEERRHGVHATPGPPARYGSVVRAAGARPRTTLPNALLGAAPRRRNGPASAVLSCSQLSWSPGHRAMKVEGPGRLDDRTPSMVFLYTRPMARRRAATAAHRGDGARASLHLGGVATCMSPPVMISSVRRPRMVTYPSSATETRSPVANQPPRRRLLRHVASTSRQPGGPPRHVQLAHAVVVGFVDDRHDARERTTHGTRSAFAVERVGQRQQGLGHAVALQHDGALVRQVVPEVGRLGCRARDAQAQHPELARPSGGGQPVIHEGARRRTWCVPVGGQDARPFRPKRSKMEAVCRRSRCRRGRRRDRARGRAATPGPADPWGCQPHAAWRALDPRQHRRMGVHRTLGPSGGPRRVHDERGVTSGPSAAGSANGRTFVAGEPGQVVDRTTMVTDDQRRATTPSWSVTIGGFGSASPTMWASSRGAAAGLTGTRVAPARRIARSASTESSVLRADQTIAHPRGAPARARPERSPGGPFFPCQAGVHRPTRVGSRPSVSTTRIGLGLPVRASPHAGERRAGRAG